MKGHCCSTEDISTKSSYLLKIVQGGHIISSSKAEKIAVRLCSPVRSQEKIVNEDTSFQMAGESKAFYAF